MFSISSITWEDCSTDRFADQRTHKREELPPLMIISAASHRVHELSVLSDSFQDQGMLRCKHQNRPSISCRGSLSCETGSGSGWWTAMLWFLVHMHLIFLLGRSLEKKDQTDNCFQIHQQQSSDQPPCVMKASIDICKSEMPGKLVPAGRGGRSRGRTDDRNRCSVRKGNRLTSTWTCKFTLDFILYTGSVAI